MQPLHAFSSLSSKNEFFIQKVYFKLGVSFLPYAPSLYSHYTSYRNSASSRIFWLAGSVPLCLTPWVRFNPLTLVPGATQILDLLCTHCTALAPSVVKNERGLSCGRRTFLYHWNSLHKSPIWCLLSYDLSKPPSHSNVCLPVRLSFRRI